MHTLQYSLRNLSHTEFLALAELAVQNLGWELSQLGHDGLVAYAPYEARVTIAIRSGQASLTCETAGEDHNKELLYQLIGRLEELRALHSPEGLSEHYASLRDKIVPDHNIGQYAPSSTSNKAKDFFQIFVPKQDYILTPIIIDINILIFILMVVQGADFMSPSSEILIQWGANFRPITLAGEWWRLLTACFLHIGILHLFMNMYALVYIGVLLEPLLGKARFIAAYLLSGLTGSLLSLYWHDNTVSAGASGAIFGMEGVFLALLTTDLIDKAARKELLYSTMFFVGFNLLYGLQGNIDNAAHIGGLLGGLLVGYAFVPSLKNYQNQTLKYATVGIVAVLVLTLTALVYYKTPNDMGIYQKQMESFSALQTEALQLYDLPADTPDSQWLKAVQEQGVQNWRECIRIIQGLDKLDLPKDIKQRNAHLKEYSELRLISFELMYKSMLENTDQYQDQIRENEKLIARKIEVLNKE